MEIKKVAWLYEARVSWKWRKYRKYNDKIRYMYGTYKPNRIDEVQKFCKSMILGMEDYIWDAIIVEVLLK